MRYCAGCKQEKNLSEFYKHKRDGYQARCKNCKRIESRLRNRQTKRKIYNRIKHREWAEKHAKEYYSRPEVLKVKAEAMKRYRNNPELRMKMEARWQVARAIKTKKLIKQPCLDCGNLKSEAHHMDYYKPLEVIWLCRVCHNLEHAKAEGR